MSETFQNTRLSTIQGDMFASRKDAGSKNDKKRSIDETWSTNQLDQTYTIKTAKVVVIPSELLVFNLVDAKEGHSASGTCKATANLIINNPTDKSIIFKFKTNASKTLLNANPCFGEIKPMKKLDININVRFRKREDLSNVKVMVASAHPPPNPQYDMKTVWSKIPQGHIMEHKLKCVLGGLGPEETFDAKNSLEGGGKRRSNATTNRRSSVVTCEIVGSNDNKTDASKRSRRGSDQMTAGNTSTFFVDVEPIGDSDEGSFYADKPDRNFINAMTRNSKSLASNDDTFDTAYMVQMFFYVILGIAFTQVFIS